MDVPNALRQPSMTCADSSTDEAFGFHRESEPWVRTRNRAPGSQRASRRESHCQSSMPVRGAHSEVHDRHHGKAAESAE